ncbi:MAG: hypothetical protein AUK17_01895 [Parcubacteria group bacterium CG2_30_44_18]|nr:MAG: hypothetical protein AUK17_01895 [Parcubacteria group bacterium CG2_30_44_18]
MFLLLFNLSPIFYTHIKHRRPIVNIVFVAQIPCLYFILSLHKHQLKTGLKDLFFNFIDIVVARVWVGGTRATFLGGAFREAKYEKLRRRKNRNRKARAGKNFYPVGSRSDSFGAFPPTPFLFARPSENYQNSASGFSRKKVRILSKRDSHHGQRVIIKNFKKLIQI